MSDRVLTVEQVAEMLQVHWQTVRGYIKSGKLPAVKVGRSIRIRESDVNKLVEPAKEKKVLHEIELRFLLPDRQVVEKKLIEMGARVIYKAHVIDHWFAPTHIRNMADKDEWYDTGKGFGNRIREQDNGYTGKWTTTLEVKRLVVPGKHDTCIEHEVRVDSFEETKRLLELMDQKEFTTVDKDRLVYAIGELKIAIDDILDFGVGVEVELMTDRPRDEVVEELMEFARKIGIDAEKTIVERSLTYLFMQKFAKF